MNNAPNISFERKFLNFFGSPEDFENLFFSKNLMTQFETLLVC